MSIYLQIFIFSFLLILSGIFSASETALISFNKLDLDRERDKKYLDGAMRHWLSNPNSILSTILVTNNVINTSLATLASSIATTYFGLQNSIFLPTVVVASAILVFGEITPKLIAKNYSKSISFLLIAPLSVLTKLLYPVVFITTHLSKFISRIFGFKIVDKDIATVTEKDIRSIISFGKEEGIIEEEKREMLDAVLDFSNLTVGDLAVPRQNMFMLRASDSLEKAMPEIISKGFSRIPVYGDNFDDILGALYIRDIIPIIKDSNLDSPIKAFIRDISFVPETKNAFSLLKYFKEKKVHIALVVDEYGGTSGLITIEDILEQIVGDIEDEFDKPEIDIKKISEDKFLIKGSVDIDDINKRTGLGMPENIEYDSLGGFLSFITGKVPERGEVILWENLEITVKETEQHAVKYAIVQKVDIERP